MNTQHPPHPFHNVNGGLSGPPTQVSMPSQLNLMSHGQPSFVPGGGYKAQVERCDQCQEMFSSLASLTRHLHKSHGGSGAKPRPYVCKTCNKCFANASYLSQHNRIHLGIKPFGCKKCGKAFTQLTHLKQHDRTHTGEKPYKCRVPGCIKAFSQLSNLQSHSRSHLAEQPWRCHSCYKVFQNESTLVEHIKEHQRAKETKSHICPHCGKTYAQKVYLEKHVNKHLEQKAAAANGLPVSHSSRSSHGASTSTSKQSTDTIASFISGTMIESPNSYDRQHSDITNKLSYHQLSPTMAHQSFPFGSSSHSEPSTPTHPYVGVKPDLAYGIKQEPSHGGYQESAFSQSLSKNGMLNENNMNLSGLFQPSPMLGHLFGSLRQWSGAGLMTGNPSFGSWSNYDAGQGNAFNSG